MEQIAGNRGVETDHQSANLACWCLAALFSACMVLPARAENCPAPPESLDPAVEMLRPFDTPDFRAKLRLGHAWRDSSGFVGEYYTRLEMAAFLGEVDLVKKLVDVPFVPPDVVLSAAALSIYAGNADVLVVLIEHGHLSPDARFAERVPLVVLASAAGDTKGLRELLGRGADMYARSDSGDALTAAVMNHQRESMIALLSAGFDQTRSHTSNALSPVQLARKLDDPCAARILSGDAR